MSANLPPLPEPHSTRKVWVDGIPSHLFTAEQMFAFRARGLAAQAAEVEALRAKVAEWEKLRDPVTLHVSLLRGFPARLSRAVFLHLAGDEEPKF